MKIALAYSRQWPFDFANQVDYLMKPMVTFSESIYCTYAGYVSAL